MLHPRAFLAVIIIASLALPRTVSAGHLFIQGYYQGSHCWCEAAPYTQGWNWFPVVYVASEARECPAVSVAFRIEGVPDDPALMRRFQALGTGSSGDPFGEGIIVHGYGLVLTEVGSIGLYITTPLAPQVWSVEAPRGMPGVTSPVTELDGAPGVWEAEIGHATKIGSANPQCDACLDQRVPLP